MVNYENKKSGMGRRSFITRLLAAGLTTLLGRTIKIAEADEITNQTSFQNFYLSSPQQEELENNPKAIPASNYLQQTIQSIGGNNNGLSASSEISMSHAPNGNLYNFYFMVPEPSSLSGNYNIKISLKYDSRTDTYSLDSIEEGPDQIGKNPILRNGEKGLERIIPALICPIRTPLPNKKMPEELEKFVVEYLSKQIKK